MGHITNNNAVGIVLSILIFVVLYLLYGAYRARQEMRMREAVIEKFSSAADFASFVQSPAGQSFISSLVHSEPLLRTLISSIQKGIILVLLGGGVCVLGVTLESAAEIVSAGVILISIGGGVLVSAVISGRLSKKWGLISEHPGDHTKPPESEYRPQRWQ
ncbi:MAG TPA: hypothetical protein VGI80_08515 [Pyrinomonadaceae bacterium]|jgi:hypothetical protein